jgi:hypothetical protein
VGQQLTYRALFRRDHPGAAVVGLGVVCEEGNALVELACEELGDKRMEAAAAAEVVAVSTYFMASPQPSGPSLRGFQQLQKSATNLPS